MTEKQADRLSVKIVSLVMAKVTKDGKLYAYEGIEAAREIKALILKAEKCISSKP